MARVILNNLNSKTLYISSCLYFYRRRSDGSSTMGKQDKILNDKNFYINTTKEAYLSVVDECLKVNGLIPKSIQRWLLCLYILQFIHLRQAINNSQILKILSDQEVKYFFQIWKKIFSHIDDKLILYENNIALFGIFDKYMTLLLFKSFNDYSESVFVEDYSHDKIKIYYLTLREKKFSIIMDNNILFLEPEKEYFLNKKINKYYHILSKEDFKKLYFKTNKNIIDICYNGNFLKIFYSNFKINFPMIISAKPDGFGMRLSSILVGIYLAKKLNFKFYFLWPKHSDLEEYNIREHGVVIPDSSIVFKEDFLNKYLIAFHNEIKINYGNEIYSKKRTISELKNIDFRKQWGWYSTEKNPSEWIFNINKTECLKDLSKIYSEIGFSLEFNNIIEHAKKVSKEFKNGFIALHIRSGDVIYSESRNLVFHPMMEERYFPYEIAIEIILSQNSSSAIVIFGQDKAANKLLIHFVKSIRKNLQVFAIDDIFEYNDSEKQMFFEVNLLAQAKIIYSVKESAFSKLAMYISGKNNLTSFHDIFSSNEQIYIIKKYFKKLSLPFLQQSMSLFFISKYFYENKEYMKAIRFAKLALNKDQSNYGYIIFLMQNYLQLDDQIKADFTIKKIHSFKEIYIFLKYLFHWSNNEICKNIILKEYDSELIYLNMLKILILIHSNNVSLAIRLFDKFLKNQNYEKLIEVKFYQMMFLNPSIKIRMSLSYRLGYILIQFYKTSINPIRLISLLRNEIDNFNKIKNIIEIEAKQYSFDGKNSEKIKNHLSYKLGNILIKAHKSKFKIGYALLPIKFFIIIYNHKRGKI
ncbi:hypothetical protein H2259_07345 [Campylobacter sp. RM10532]|nr:hypothetical protein [Campylobacter sp. RM10532]